MEYRLTFIAVALVALLVLHPHLTMHLPEGYRAFAESLLNALIAGSGALAYYVHRRRLRESADKIARSYQYIGSIHRRIPLLSDMTTKLISQRGGNGEERKKAFNSLLNTAVISVARADWGVLRFVETRKMRTVREFRSASSSASPLSSIPNKALTEGGKKLETGHFLFRTSDRHASIQAFLILPAMSDISDREPLLQSVADQAQLLYAYLFPDSFYPLSPLPS